MYMYIPLSVLTLASSSLSLTSEPSATLTSHEYSTHPLALGETPINLNTISPADPVTVTNGEVPSTTGILNDIIAANGEIPMKSPSDYIINAKVIVYAALGGMVSFLPDGTIHGCNHHFSLMLFGYSQEELLKKVRPCSDHTSASVLR